MDIKEIIQKKRERKELTREEIFYFIGKFLNNEISDAQVGALMSYIYINGLTDTEILELVRVMAKTGTTIDLSEISSKVVDKHSTGGVGDKATLILMPVIASLGVPVAKISSRGYGITCGTIDKLECIPGFNANISIEQFKQNVKNIGVSIISQDFNLAPVESKMYRLRNEVACSDCIPLIAASLLSLKLATGSNKLVFDITCGKGTYIKSREEARKLSKLLIKLGKDLGKDVTCVITSMDEPLGHAIGHNLEIDETIECLRGNMPKDIEEVVKTVGSAMLSLVNEENDTRANMALITESLRSGKAYEKFKEMITAQGGDVSFLERKDRFRRAKYMLPVYSTADGYVDSVDAGKIGKVAMYLGAGRMKKHEQINRSAGIILQKKIGDYVRDGEVLAYIFTDEEDKVPVATKNIREAYALANKRALLKGRVLEVI